MDLYDELTQLDLQSSLQVLQSSIDALFRLPEVFDAAKFREDIYSNLQNCFVVQEQLFIKHQYYDLTGIKTNDIAADAVAAAATANIPSIAAAVAAPSTTASSRSAAESEVVRATAAVIPAAAIDSICDATALTTSSAAATLEPAFSLSQHEVNLGMDVIKRFDECLSQALKADTMLTSLVNNIIEDNSLYNLLKRSEMTLPAFLNKLGKSMLIVFSV